MSEQNDQPVTRVKLPKVGAQLYLLLALLVALLAAIAVQGPRIADEYAVEEDFRKFSYMHRFTDPGLLTADSGTIGAIREEAAGPLRVIFDSSSPGYSLLFQGASYFVPVITFSKIVGIPLLLLSVYYLYRIGVRLRGPGTGLGLALAFTALNMASPASLTVLTGLQRAFMAPLVLAVLYSLLIGRDWAAAVALVLGGLIYLPAFALGAATYGLTLLGWDGKGRRPRFSATRIAPLAAAMALVLLVHAPTVVRQIDNIPDAPSPAQAAAEPAAAEASNAAPTSASRLPLPAIDDRAAGGRYELFWLFPLVGRVGLSDGMALAAYIAILSAMSIFTFLLSPNSLARLPRTIKLLGLAGVLCFVLAWAAFLVTDSFPLYLPSRYSQAALFFFTLIYVVVNFEETVHRTVSGLHANRARLVYLLAPAAAPIILLAIFLPPDSLGTAIAGGLLRWILVFLAAVLVLLALVQRRRSGNAQVGESSVTNYGTGRRRWALFGGILFLLGLGNVFVMQSQFLVATADERELYRFLESLPADVMISGNPCDLDGIPLFAKRMVLLSCERPRSNDIAWDTLTAYYAADAEEIAGYCRQHSIDYLVVNKDSFEQEQLQAGDYYFEPFNSHLQPLLSQQEFFAMPGLVERAGIFENQTFGVVPCDQGAADGRLPTG